MAARKSARKTSRKTGRKATPRKSGSRSSSRRSREFNDEEMAERGVERPFIFDGVEFFDDGKIRFVHRGLAARVQRYYYEKFCHYLQKHCCKDADEDAGERPDGGEGGFNSAKCGPPNEGC